MVEKFDVDVKLTFSSLWEKRQWNFCITFEQELLVSEQVSIIENKRFTDNQKQLVTDTNYQQLTVTYLFHTLLEEQDIGFRSYKIFPPYDSYSSIACKTNQGKSSAWILRNLFLVFPRASKHGGVSNSFLYCLVAFEQMFCMLYTCVM